MSKALKDIIKAIIPEQHLWKIELFKAWDYIIGPMKTRVQIEKIEDRTLFLIVTHATWAQEVHMISPLIKQKINRFLNEEKIATIRIHNKRSSYKPLSLHSNNKQSQNVPLIPLSEKESSILAPLTSHKLHSSIASYLVRCKTLQGSKNEKK